MVPEQRGSAATERRVGVLDALRALVADAESGSATRVAAHLDDAVSGWCLDVETPAEAVTLVAELRRETRMSRSREQVLELVTWIAVTRVAERQVREALTDPLTGLATRARMEDETEHLLAMSLRADSPLTAVILDVDGLKKINDEQGHAAGDAALAAVGVAIREHARKTDRAYRWGGDEFVILMPGTTEQVARQVVERIQESCVTRTTAGVAMHADGAGEVDVAMWLSAADADLYSRRSAQRGTTTRRPRRFLPARPSSGAALLGLATVAALTGGWFGATSVVRSGGTPRSASVTQALGSTAHTTASRPVPIAGTTRSVVVVPAVVRPAPAPRAVTHGSAPVKPATTSSLVPPVVIAPVDVPLPQNPTVVTPVPLTPEPTTAPVGLVRGLLRTVRSVLSDVSL